MLFIDEAYELGKGQFGVEACSTLVAAMTNPQYAGLVIIIAGYQAEIHEMLNTNVGLKSRFQHFMQFADWTANCRYSDSANDDDDSSSLVGFRSSQDDRDLVEWIHTEMKDVMDLLLHDSLNIMDL